MSTGSPRTPAPPAAKADVRADLLRAAEAELDEHGSAGISLRAVARRAGVSHAAPKNHFRDRAGLLTAVATRGFRELTASLAAIGAADGADRLRALGTAYVDFGLHRGALFDLMFRSVELDTDDPDLLEAQAAAFAPLASSAGDVAGGGDGSGTAAVMAWALVHGLVVLVADHALHDPERPGDQDAARSQAHRVVAAFVQLLERPQHAR